ncbi:MAG: CCA tRNA nucleotidyltransferase, partial [Chloroflexota bacterium]
MTAPARALLDAASHESDEAAVPLWLVGGAVRDLALGRPAHDLDLALAEDTATFAARVVARLRDVGYEDVEVEVEPRFGTASVRLSAGGAILRLDLARLRSERYVAPGDLPTVEFTSDLDSDLARRDFSV